MKRNTKGKRVSAVRGDYIYYHYNQDINDDGWGCAYRSLQTLVSWMRLQGIEAKQPPKKDTDDLEKESEMYEVPTIPKIQEILVEIGDKPRSFCGSKEWIGAFEVSYVINKVCNIESMISHVSTGEEVIDKIGEFERHFQEVGAPIMIGGGVLAYTLLGVAIDDEKPEESQFLILDPHYKSSDKYDKITDSKKGGVWWKGKSLFLKNHFYNFCIPKPDLF